MKHTHFFTVLLFVLASLFSQHVYANESAGDHAIKRHEQVASAFTIHYTLSVNGDNYKGEFNAKVGETKKINLPEHHHLEANIVLKEVVDLGKTDALSVGFVLKDHALSEESNTSELSVGIRMDNSPATIQLVSKEKVPMKLIISALPVAS